MRYRLRLQWADPTAPSSKRVELIYSNNPTGILRLLAKIEKKPDRPLRRVVVEATVREFWSEIPLDFLRWRSAQKERLDLEREAARRRAEKGGGRNA